MVKICAILARNSGCLANLSTNNSSLFVSIMAYSCHLLTIFQRPLAVRHTFNCPLNIPHPTQKLGSAARICYIGSIKFMDYDPA
jgi:hypothetical protein